MEIDKKISALQSYLQKGTSVDSVTHDYVSFKYKFVIYTKKANHVLYVNKMLMEDYKLDEIISLLNSHQVSTLFNSTNELKLYIDGNGIREVDADFEK